MEKVSIKKRLLKELREVENLSVMIAEEGHLKSIIDLHQTKILILTALQKYEVKYESEDEHEFKHLYVEKGDY